MPRASPADDQAQHVADLRRGWFVAQFDFRGAQKTDPLGLHADFRADALASLIGIAVYRGIERGGQFIKIKDLVKL